MGMLSTDDLSVAMGGQDFTPAEAAKAQTYIDRITAYIEGETDIRFGTVTGEQFKKRSDSGGVVQFSQWPIHDITAVHEVRNDIDLVIGGSVYFDGVDRFYGLRPNKLYLFTMDYGQDPVPADIKGVAVDAVIRALNTEVTALKSRTTGDVTEVYGGMLDFGATDQIIIDNYSETEATWRLTSNIFQSQHGDGWCQQVVNGPSCAGDCGC